MNTLDERKLGCEILEKLYLLDPSSIIAGGAPRDWFFDKTCSDIDVYFYYRPDLSLSIVSNVLSGIFGTDMLDVGNNHGNQEHRYLRDKNISNVWEFGYHGKNIQLIRRAIPTFGVVGGFALNLSMAWFKGNRLYLEEPFLTGVKYKSIVKMNELYCDGDKYVKKIRDKFPSYLYFTDELSFYKHFAKLNYETR